MILADKIIKLRQKNGWSLEELAYKMDVSRQAVSKWETSQSIPDLQKLLQLSQLFGVTVDYLVKDELEVEEFTNECESNVKTITLEEANKYIKLRKKASWQIAIATIMCILAPVTLIILGGLSDIPNTGITETFMAVVGLVTLFVLIICAVSIFIYTGFKNEQYAFLDHDEPFILEYGVKGLVIEKKKNLRPRYILFNILATILCIISPIPLITSAFFENEMIIILMLGLLFIICGVGVFLFILMGVQNASMNKLLREGEYSEKEKRRTALKEVVGFTYWGLIVIIFLIWSYLYDVKHFSWIIFVIGGILFPLVLYICNAISDRKKRTI